jgi:hypothetical protein
MSEPTPPPERPMSDGARARIRGELLAHAHENRSGAPRWLVPASAAAAVALVAGLAYWAISPGGAEPDGLPVTGGGDTSGVPSASAGGATDAPANEGTSTPTPAGSTAPETLPETTSTKPVEGGDTVQAGAGDCRTELEYVLKGAEQVQSEADESFWVKGDKFSFCYQVDGSTTVTHPLPVDPQEGVATYRVASVYPPTADGFRTVRFAGGVVPAGAPAFDVAYTFPDGHTEPARTVQDDSGRTWWWMVYSYDDGGGNEMKKPPIEVTVSYSGVQKSYQLEWGTDTCVQANHGC